MKLTRGEREVDDVNDCGDKNRCAFIEMPSEEGIGSESDRTVRQNLEYFRFRSRCESGEKSGAVCCRRRVSVEMM